jgi:hypothetical protein
MFSKVVSTFLEILDQEQKRLLLLFNIKFISTLLEILEKGGRVCGLGGTAFQPFLRFRLNRCLKIFGTWRSIVRFNPS